MALGHSPRIVTDGLILCLDAANIKSYPGSGTAFNDISGKGNNHTLTGSPAYSATNRGQFYLDGSQGFSRSGALAGVTANCTVVIWYSTVDTQELWVVGAGYLSASAGNNYYHSAIGSPTNYVDLATVVRPDTPVNYRNGAYHMWEAKNVDFTSWTTFGWFLYGGAWNMVGNVSQIMVYNRALTATESIQNFNAHRGRYGI